MSDELDRLVVPLGDALRRPRRGPVVVVLRGPRSAAKDVLLTELQALLAGASVAGWRMNGRCRVASVQIEDVLHLRPSAAVHLDENAVYRAAVLALLREERRDRGYLSPDLATEPPHQRIVLPPWLSTVQPPTAGPAYWAMLLVRFLLTVAQKTSVAFELRGPGLPTAVFISAVERLDDLEADVAEAIRCTNGSMIWVLDTASSVDPFRELTSDLERFFLRPPGGVVVVSMAVRGR